MNPGGTSGVLAVLQRPAAAAAQLAAAVRLARLLGGVQPSALAMRRPATDGIMPTEEILTHARQAEWDAAEQARIAALQAACDATPSVALRVADGEPAELTAEAGKQFDYLVIARPTEAEDAVSRAIGHAALFATGRPVLVVPEGFSGVFGQTIAIAFQEDGRADKALLAALPLLRQARRVRVFGEAALPDLLMEHAIAATPCPLAADGFGPALWAAMAEGGDDMLVMGAYTHSAWRESLLGGMTREALTAATVPVLMRH